MKIMKKMLLLNWHYFWNELIEFEMINFLTGRNAAGKSTLIDALQLLLLGDTSGSFFNKAANEKSTRTLKGYLWGEIGEDGDINFRYLRTGRFTSYIACEFYDDLKKKSFTLGVVFDCYDDGSFEHKFFALDAPIPEERFIAGKLPMSYKQLKAYAHNNLKRSRFEFPETNRGYQDLLKGKLGGLKNKYFSLLKKAVPFSPIKDIEAFITEYVCDVKSIVDISSMQDNIRYYKRLEQDAAILEKRVAALRDIAEKYELWQEEKNRLQIQNYIIDRSRHQIVLDTLEELKEELRSQKEELAAVEAGQILCEETLKQYGTQKDKLIADKISSDIYKKQEELTAKKNQLQAEIERLTDALAQITRNLRKYGLIWRENARRINNPEKEFLARPEITVASDFAEEWEKVRTLACDVEKYAERLIDLTGEALAQMDEQGFSAIRDSVAAFKDQAGLMRYSLSQAQKETEGKLAESKTLLASMESGIKPYDRKLTELREAIRSGLAELYGKEIEVHILADLLEVKDPRWHNAVEGYLHSQKFYLLVEPEYFVDALKIYDKLKFASHFYDWGLIDSGKLIAGNPSAKPGSLAEEVVTENKEARAFVDYLLGNVIKCERVEDLRHYERAITDSGMLYQNYVARQLNPNRWRVPYIGRRALDEQIRIKKEEITQLELLLELYRPRLKALENIAAMEAMNDNEIKNTLAVIDRTRALPSLEDNRQTVLKELESLDLSWLMGLDEQINKLEEDIRAKEKENKELLEKIGDYKRRIATAETEKIPAEEKSGEEKRQNIAHTYDGTWLAEIGEPRFQKELAARNNASEVYNNFYSQVARTQKQTEKKYNDLTAARSDYNRDYKMSYDINLSDNGPFARELKDLSEVKLPEYLQKIQDARNKAAEQFRDDFLAKLKSNIDTVKNQIEELNAALKESSWGNDKYRFVVTPKTEYKPYYDMITDDLLLEGYNIASQIFRDKHKDAIDELFKRIVDVDYDMDAETRAEIEKNIKMFTDYRTYLKFDLIVTDEEGSQRLSRTLNKKSGGETQTPFYISVLASFAQLYRVRHKNESGNTMRLIIFDEAFSKMDSERIQESIKLLRRFGLQALLSAPPEKIGDIGPLVDRNLCVFRSADRSYVKAFDSRQIMEEFEE